MYYGARNDQKKSVIKQQISMQKTAVYINVNGDIVGYT